jgi:hypothetical protein
VSPGAHLCTGSPNYTLASFPLYAEPIIIGADALICTEALVGPGGQIGAGAVIRCPGRGDPLSAGLDGVWRQSRPPAQTPRPSP